MSKVVLDLKGTSVVRTGNNKDGYLITDDGNLILDIKFKSIKDFKELNHYLKSITGVVETSIFTKEVTKIIVSMGNGIRVISR